MVKGSGLVKAGAWLLVCLLSGGCTTGGSLMRAHGEPTPRFADFKVCHGYGCFSSSRAALNEGDEARLRALFAEPAQTPDAERAQIAAAVAFMEQVVGAQIGTDADLGGAAFLRLSGIEQQDCIDEAVNTTTYLKMMEAAGLLRFHTVDLPAHRGLDIGRWPHNSAVIVAPDGARFAVDSWFHANGEEPEIMPLELWQSGWSPQTPPA